MQLHIDFSADMLNLPISYNTIIQGFIYNALSVADSSFSDYIHNKVSEQGINLFKLFTFGRLSGDYKIKGHEIIFPKRASLEIRSCEPFFTEKLMSVCKTGDTVKLGTNYVKINGIFAEDKKITESELNAFCISPFVYRVPFSESNTFDEAVAKYKTENNALKKWLSAGFDERDFNLDIDFANNNPERVHSVFKNIHIAAWNTSFTLKGNPATLDFLYNTGIGSRNSQGFGMFGMYGSE